MISFVRKWLPIGFAVILVVLSLALLLVHRQVGLRLAQRWASPSKSETTPTYWTSAMKDEDKSLLVATPAPRQVESVRESTFYKFYRGNPNRKEIALTFDDGPHVNSTPKLLETLKQYHVKATFFIVGSRAAEHPELVEEEALAGHCLANHTYHHDRLTKVPNAAVPSEITTCTDLIKKITGQTTHYFRPPGGTFDRKVTDIAQSLGYLTILWTVNTGDFETQDSNLIAQRALRHIENGSIILFHDRGMPTILALQQIIPELKNQGYRFVTIDEMVTNN